MRFQSTRFTAQRALLTGWLIWTVCFLLLPVEPVFHGEVSSVALLVFSNLAVLAGIHLSSRWGADTSDASIVIERSSAEKLLFWLFALALIATLARSVDYFVIRGVSVTADVSDIREDLTAGPNPLSAIAAILSPAMLAAGVLGMAFFVSGTRSIVCILSMCMFLVLPAFAVLQGSRSVVIVVFGTAVIASLLIVPRLSARVLGAAAFLAAAVFVLTMAVYLNRIEGAARAFDEVVRDSAYTELVPVSDAGLAVLDRAPRWLASVLFYLISVAQYAVHGVFEFFFLVQEKSKTLDPLLWGRYQFFVIDQVFRLFSPAAVLVDLEDFNPASGVFSTFWGPAFIDFGYFFMPVYGFIFGAIVGFFQRRVRGGDILALPLYVVFGLQVFLMPVANFIIGAGTLYFNLGLFALWLLGRLGPLRRLAVAGPRPKIADRTLVR